MKLYDIPTEFQTLWEQIEAIQANEALTDGEREQQLSEVESLFRVMLQESHAKVEAAAKVVRTLDAETDAVLAEAKRLNSRASSLQRNSDRLKALMLFAVDTAFAGKVKTPLFSIWGQTSAATVKFEAAPDADLMKLPAEFVRVSADLNRKALADAFKAGEAIPDAIIASEHPGTRFLRIK